MGKTSAIQHPILDQEIIIRRSYLLVANGDLCRAAMLGRIEAMVDAELSYQYNHDLSVLSRSNKNKDNLVFLGEIQWRLNQLTDDRTVNSHIPWFLERGFLQSKKEDGKTLYWASVETIQQAIDSLKS